MSRTGVRGQDVIYLKKALSNGIDGGSFKYEFFATFVAIVDILYNILGELDSKTF